MRTKDRCPSCKYPIVGTKPMVLPLAFTFLIRRLVLAIALMMRMCYYNQVRKRVKHNIKRLFNENKITVSDNFTIEDLCKARNKIVHAGKEIMNLNNSPITHNCCDAIEKILRQLLLKLLSNLTSDLQT